MYFFPPEDLHIPLLQAVLFRVIPAIVIFQEVVLYCDALYIMHQRYFLIFRKLRFAGCLQQALCVQVIPMTRVHTIGELLRREPLWKEGFLITIILTCSTDTSNMWFPTICGEKRYKGMDTFFWSGTTTGRKTVYYHKI